MVTVTEETIIEIEEVIAIEKTENTANFKKEVVSVSEMCCNLTDKLYSEFTWYFQNVFVDFRCQLLRTILTSRFMVGI